MTAFEVKCTVKDCFFHAIGDICGAEKIEINMNPKSNKQEHSEFAQDFDAKLKSAQYSADTCCKTFKSKKIYSS